MIEISDKFLSVDDVYSVINYCKMAPYNYGEVDYAGVKPTGMIHSVKEDSWIYELFRSKTENLVNGLTLNRMYVNCFAPGENPYWHIDGSDGITFIYYSNDEWNIDFGGETQFLIDDEIKGILPLPNRMIYFPANTMHRATSFRDRHRFTLALKYGHQVTKDIYDS